MMDNLIWVLGYCVHSPSQVCAGSAEGPRELLQPHRRAALEACLVYCPSYKHSRWLSILSGPKLGSPTDGPRLPVASPVELAGPWLLSSLSQSSQDRGTYGGKSNQEAVVDPIFSRAGGLVTTKEARRWQLAWSIPCSRTLICVGLRTEA
jgi:hypothetical protein